jgi:23S rRNA pseudouridine2457 synthase
MSGQHFLYYLFNKPFGVYCQFSPIENQRTLADFGPFPRSVYAAGRLDHDSEGLLLLTNDGAVQHALMEPKFRHPRTYLAQVERIPSAEALEKLRAGVIIEGKCTLPAEVTLLAHDPELPPRPVPIRYRKSVPTAWIELTIYEGRNRQVRKMTAAAGHPTLRLVRIRIANLSLGELKPGEYRKLTKEEVLAIRALVVNRGDR